MCLSAADAGDCVVRLCHLKIWPDFAGYGFNLHADRATPGQYVGKVDERSPAEAAGLKLNDRIVEVNGSSVDGKSHADVVMEIKSVAGEVRLLVVDAAADEFYRNAGVNISSSTVTDIQTIVCPDTGPHFSTGDLLSSVSVCLTPAPTHISGHSYKAHICQLLWLYSKAIMFYRCT